MIDLDQRAAALYNSTAISNQLDTGETAWVSKEKSFFKDGFGVWSPFRLCGSTIQCDRKLRVNRACIRFAANIGSFIVFKLHAMHTYLHANVAVFSTTASGLTTVLAIGIAIKCW